MAEPIRIGDFLFSEIDFDLLSACQDGHKAEVWTKPDYEYINLYLEGFDMGAGKVAALKKSDNPFLVRLMDSHSIIYAVVQKKSDTLYAFIFKERTEEDLLASVAQARALSDSASFQIGSAERELKSLAMKKLLAKYKPSNLSISCALRTPEPIRLPMHSELQILDRIPQWYIATNFAYVMFREAASGVTGYVRASHEVRTRIAKAHFNGYRVTAKVTGIVEEVQTYGLASIWDETEHFIDVLFRT